MKFVSAIFLILVSTSAFAYKFDSRLIDEINSIKPIYEKGLKLSEKEFCGLDDKKVFPNDEQAENYKAKCNRMRSTMKQELECIKNAPRIVKTNPFELGKGARAYDFFVDNNNYSCFDEEYQFSGPLIYGTEIEKARIRMFEATRKYKVIY